MHLPLPLPLLIFFGALAVCLILMLCAGCVAKCYLSGKFIKIRKNDEDIDQPFLETAEEIDEFEDSENKPHSAPLSKWKKAAIIAKYKRPEVEGVSSESKPNPTLLVKAQEFKQFTEQSALGKIRESFDDFASSAIVSLQLQYLENTKCIVGNVKTINGFNFKAKQVPKDIQFHLKLLPGDKFRRKTAWRSASSKLLMLSFTIGPVSTEKVLKCCLCMRLYGRKSSKMYGQSRCYGETSVDLKILIGKDQPVSFEKPILPRGRGSITNDFEDNRFTTDSETEHV